MRWREKWDEFVKTTNLIESDRCHGGKGFLTAVEEKLDRGAAEYGDSTFEMALREVVKNIKEESVDLVGWTYFYWLNNRDKTDGDKMAIEGLLFCAESAWRWCQMIEGNLDEK